MHIVGQIINKLYTKGFTLFLEIFAEKKGFRNYGEKNLFFFFLILYNIANLIY